MFGKQSDNNQAGAVSDWGSTKSRHQISSTTLPAKFHLKYKYKYKSNTNTNTNTNTNMTPYQIRVTLLCHGVTKILTPHRMH